jgi:hypothetical protein
MLTELLIELSPLKIFFFGLLFFWASWMATKKILILSIIGLTAGETTWSAIQGQVDSVSTNPLVVQAASAAGMPIHNGSALAPLVANVMLALSMATLVQAIRVYTRAKRDEMEIKLRHLELQGDSKVKWRSPGTR